MSWVTFVFALVIGACVTIALPNLLTGIKGRRWENLFFVLAALSVAGIAWGELAMMHSRTVRECIMASSPQAIPATERAARTKNRFSHLLPLIPVSRLGSAMVTHAPMTRAKTNVTQLIRI